MNMIRLFSKKTLCVTALFALCTHVSAEHKLKTSELLHQVSPGGGFMVLAEHRFNPWVQRMMAENSLKSMPLSNGRLYFVYPVNMNPQLEEMQIRYMEELLEKQEEVKKEEAESRKNDEP